MFRTNDKEDERMYRVIIGIACGIYVLTFLAIVLVVNWVVR